MTRFFLWLSLVAITCFNPAFGDDWQTDYELSHFKSTPTYQQTIRFCQRLAAASPWIQFRAFGQSAQGRDLPLLIVNKEGQFRPETVNRQEKIIVLVQAGIHAGEIDGKDAGLLLLRDLVVKQRHSDLLDHIVLLFIPIFNVDGHERFGPYNRINQNGPQQTGWRTNALNLNLNRDYLKADAPETRAWLALFTRWLPDFFVDIHVTDGADYQYTTTYHLDTHGLLPADFNAFLKQKFLPQFEKALQQKGWPLINYVSFRRRHDPTSGLLGWVPWPRFSNGYTPLHNRPALLVENHMLKNYKQRVSATYDLLTTLFRVLIKEKAELKKQIDQADRQMLKRSFLESPFVLTYKRTADSVMIDFLGYDFEAQKSSLSGGIWFRFDESRSKIFHVPFFDTFVPDRQVRLPLAYLVPVEWKAVIERLKWHGIQYYQLKRPFELTVETYTFKDVQFAPLPFEGRQMVQFETRPMRFKRRYEKGSVLVPLRQKAVKVIVHILEPDAPDSFMRWGFFNTILEQKEYAESYVMEKMAREMLQQDESLRQQFQQKLKTDSLFAHNPRTILNWFYRHSPYWDRFKDVYPVGKITEQSMLDKLMEGATPCE